MTELLWLWVAGVCGAGVGHVTRRAVPRILGLKDRRTLPFETPWLEALGALVFAWVVGRSTGWPTTLNGVVFVTLLMGIVATDYLVKLIPDRLTFLGTLLGVGLQGVWPSTILGLSDWHPLMAQILGVSGQDRLSGLLLSALGAITGFFALEAIRWTFSIAVGMQVMGMGDSKLLMMIGAFLGPIGALGALILGFLLGVAHGLVYLKISGQPHSPFGPPLALGGLVMLMGADLLVGAFRALQSWVITLPLELLAGVYTVLIAIVFVLLLRTRRRAAEYEELIEEDYRQVEEKLE